MMNKAFYALAALAYASSIDNVAADNTVCTGMQPVCTSEEYEFVAEAGASLLPSETNYYGCLGTQPNPTWYYFEIDDPGLIEMNLVAARDIDFFVWGPYDSVAEATSLCNGGLTASAEIDCSYSATNDETITIPNAIAGKIYVLLITNYANQVQTVSLTKTDGDGSTNCDIVDPCPSDGFECVAGAFQSGVESCPEGIKTGYYPDLTNKNAYCYCTGTAAPSRYEACPNGLYWDSIYGYLSGDCNGDNCGSGGLWGTQGGICNWPTAVGARTQERPPYTRRARKLNDCDTPSPTPSPPTGGSFCVAGAFQNGKEGCPDGIPVGYYPDLTNKNSYCYCTGTSAPSRYESCNSGLVWDSIYGYLSGTDPNTGVSLGSGGYYGTIGGICNWEASVSARTQQRPPYNRRTLLRA